MGKKVYRRDEVNVNDTWDLSRLYKSEELYEKDLQKVVLLVENFTKNYEGKLKTKEIIIKSLDDYQELSKLITYTSSYQSLNASVDLTNQDNVIRQGKFQLLMGELMKKTTFFMSEMLLVEDTILLEVLKTNKDYQVFIENIIRSKKHQVEPVVQKALSEFNQVLGAPYQNYQLFKFSDMQFNNFEVDNKDYPLSFTLFENEWSYDTNHNLRRKSFEEFYNTLKLYENGLANNYRTHVLTEKAQANLRGFESVTDYLLFNQKVSRDLYNRQIDLIMKHLSKPMQKYANLIKDIYGLDKMTYADLHLAIDPEFEANVTIEEAKAHVSEALSVLGEDYSEMVNRAFNERWIDFPQNLGKSTGGFCSSPYQKGSYILLNWNGLMNEVFVLAHELGHAGHFYFTSKNQSILNTSGSLYFVEAPSTINELFMAEYLNKKQDDLRAKRFVLANLVSRTYYHNFVTHLLEAAFQREVYEHVDNHKPLSGRVISGLKLKVLKEFWGDAVEIPEYAGRTWMRQPHYFMGLYPYTYSAGLTIATATHNKLKNNELKHEDWLEVLSAGGTKTPEELAKMVNVDLSTDEPLLKTIEIISGYIDEIAKITKELTK